MLRRRRQTFARRLNRFLLTRWSWIVAAVILLHVAAISPHWRVFPDSATYLTLAQNLSDGNGYAIHGYPHGKYPPGFPAYLVAMSWLGLGKMVWLNIAMCAMTLAALACAYRLLREYVSPRLALLATLVLATSYQLYHLSSSQLSDVPFLLLVTAGLWWLNRGLQGGRGWLEAGSIALIGSCWIRVLGIPLALGASVGLLLQGRQVSRWRTLLNGSAILVGAVLTGLWLYLQDRSVQGAMSTESYASELAVLSTGSVAGWIGGALSNFYESSRFLSRLFTEQCMSPTAFAMVVFWFPVFVGAYYSLRKKQYIIGLATAAYLGSILLIRVPLARYFLPVAPVLLLYFGNGVRCLANRFARRSAAASSLVVAGACILIALNLPKDLRLIYRTHHPSRMELEGWQDTVCAAKFLRNHSTPTQRFISARYDNVLGYLSGTPYLPLRRDLLGQRSSDRAVRQYLKQDGVGYVIAWHTPHLSLFHERLYQAVRDCEEYQLAFRHGDIHIFARSSSESANSEDNTAGP